MKVVAQSIPMCLRSCILLPKHFCDDLNRLVANFWWNGSEGERKIHWLAWDKLCAPKSDGGLGLRNLYAFNLALLSKQAWRIINEPDLLVARVLKAKYFPSSSFTETLVKPNCSNWWRSICVARDVIKRGARWRKINGSSIKIWGDPWISFPNSFRIFSPKPSGCHVEYVYELMDPDCKSWNLQTRVSLFSHSEIDLIRSIPLSFRDVDDRFIWHFEPRGVFSIKTASILLRAVFFHP